MQQRDLWVAVTWNRSQGMQSYSFQNPMVLYLSVMKAYVLISLLGIGWMSCEEPINGESNKADSTASPDTVPREVILGKKADWAYKPDTMVNDILLGDAESLRQFKRNNGNEGTAEGNVKQMSYINQLETEELTVFEWAGKNKTIPFLLRVKKNIRDSLSGPPENYGMDRNFITSSGIYLGMPVNYIQTIYKGQPMMQWSKGDTTYLSYAPLEKDKQHFRRYTYKDYQARYKFVNDACCVYEMMISPEAAGIIAGQ